MQQATASSSAKPKGSPQAQDDDDWKAPIWQKKVDRQVILAAHDDGPLAIAKREGYLQKRAGTSRLRWNIRFFEVKDGRLRWWRPAFKDQLFQSRRGPVVALAEPRPAPSRELDLTKLQCVVKTKVKFPYSTRIMLKFQEDYTNYQLELRAEKELEIIEWFKLFLRFTMEAYEAEQEDAETELGTEAGDGDSDSDNEVAASGGGGGGAAAATAPTAATSFLAAGLLPQPSKGTNLLAAGLEVIPPEGAGAPGPQQRK